jgi:hypothetical protein
MKSGKRLAAYESSWQIMGLALLAALMISWTTGDLWIWLPVLAAGSSLYWFHV